MIVNWLLGSVYENVPPLWNFIYKDVKHTNNDMIMCNMMKCLMSEVNRGAIEKVCWKSKMKDWYLSFFSSGHRNQITCSLLGGFSKPRAEVTRFLDSVL